jgi:hypothetical protein
MDSAKIVVEEKRAREHPSSDIFVVKGTTGKDDGFKVLLRLMGENGLHFYRSEKAGVTSGPDGLIPSDAVVIVKVNSQWDERGGTNTDLVRSVIEAVLDHPDVFVGEVVVADNGQAQYGSTRRGGSLDYGRNNAEDRGQSIQGVVDSFADGSRVSTYLWNTITTNRVSEYFMGDDEDGYIVDEAAVGESGLRVSYPKFRTMYGTRISFRHGVWRPDASAYDTERLKVVNVPVLRLRQAHRRRLPQERGAGRHGDRDRRHQDTRPKRPRRHLGERDPREGAELALRAGDEVEHPDGERGPRRPRPLGSETRPDAGGQACRPWRPLEDRP